MAEPLGPYWSTVGIRQIRTEGTAVLAAPILDIRGTNVAVEYIAPTSSQPTPSIRVTFSGPTQEVLDAVEADLQDQIDGIDGRLSTQEILEEPFLVAASPTITIDWSATGGRRHVKISTVVSDSVNLAASTNAIEGYTYTVTFSGAASDRTYDANWVAGSSGFLYPASGDPEVIVYKFVFMEGKMRQIGNHYSAP